MTDRENRDTPAPYSAAAAAQIRQLIVTPGARLACPRCDGDLTMAGPIAGGGSMAAVWELRCQACRRSLMVRDLPETRPRG